jgi:DNA-binding transcriptional regulator YiaG
MEKKRVKKFRYEGLGFPIVLFNVPMAKVRDVWTPAFDFNELQKAVLLELCDMSFPLSGNQVHFIRTYFEMTLDAFGKHFGVTHAGVINWEKTKNRAAKINPSLELMIRLFILEKLKINNQIFRDIFRDFNMQQIMKARKTTFEHKPLQLHNLHLNKKAFLNAS